MRGTTHLAAGLLVGSAYATLIDAAPLTAIALTGAAAIGSLAPDLDNGWSTLGRKFPLLSHSIACLIGHRTLLHSAIPWAIAVAVALRSAPVGLPRSAIISAGLGVLSHLFLDAMTRSGIPLCWPISPRRIHLSPAKTGGITDYAIATLCNAFFVLICIRYAQANGWLPIF